MTKNKTIAYGQKIRSRLNDSGWELETIEPESEWYSTEHWKFVSNRQAYGYGIYISFMIDPQCESRRTIWCVRAGINIPTYFHHANGEIAELYMSRGMFGEKLDAFINAINEYRNKVHMRTAKQET